METKKASGKPEALAAEETIAMYGNIPISKEAFQKILDNTETIDLKTVKDINNIAQSIKP